MRLILIVCVEFATGRISPVKLSSSTRRATVDSPGTEAKRRVSMNTVLQTSASSDYEYLYTIKMYISIHELILFMDRFLLLNSKTGINDQYTICLDNYRLTSTDTYAEIQNMHTCASCDEICFWLFLALCTTQQPSTESWSIQTAGSETTHYTSRVKSREESYGLRKRGELSGRREKTYSV